MTASQIQSAVSTLVSNHQYKLTNVYIHDWEADFFSVTKTLYTWEIEIKCSRSDFFADFKKPKHHFFKSFRKGHGILRFGETYTMEGWPLTNKFPELKGYRIPYTSIAPQPFNHTTAPNKFFFAVPSGMILPHEVPPYAGLLYVTKDKEITLVKKPEWLHRDPINYKNMLFDKYYWMYIHQLEEIRGLKSHIESLKSTKAQ